MLTFAAKIIINQKHKMKTFYSLFLFVVAALFGVTAQAQVEIVTSVESPITTLETLKTGSQLFASVHHSRWLQMSLFFPFLIIKLFVYI